MGEPLCAAARLIAEISPLRSFLLCINESDLLSNKERACGLEVPDEQFWRSAAESVLSELKDQPPSPNAQEKKVLLRWMLRRAQNARQAAGCLTGGSTGSGVSRRVEQLLSLRSQGPRRSVSALPAGVTEAFAGLFLVELSAAEASAADDCKCVDLCQQLGVDDVLKVSDCATASGSNAGQQPEIWSVYRLCEDRVTLLFDEGKSVLVAGPRNTLACVFCGLLLRCWHLSREDAEQYMSRVGWDSKEVPEAFYKRVIDLGLVGSRAIFLPLPERPIGLACGLHAHLRLLEERRQGLWPPVLRGSEALLLQSVDWEPQVQDAASTGLVCVAALQTLRTELAAAANIRPVAALQDLVGVHWSFGGSHLVEDGIILAAAAQEGPGVIGPSQGPLVLADELQQELQHAKRLPKLLVVAVEGCRPMILRESMDIRISEGSHRYHTYVIAAAGGIISRDPASGLANVPGSSRMDEGKLLLRQTPAVVVLAHALLPNRDSWMPWQQMLDTVGSGKLPLSPSRRSFKLHLITLAQYFGARRSCKRNSSAWEEAETLGAYDIPVDARASLLFQRMATRVQVPVAWQLLLAPSEQGWRFLLPSARVIDHVIAPCGSSGPVFLIVSCPNEPNLMWAPSLQPEASQDPTTFLTFPWVPVICYSWFENQLTPLDVLLFDARRPVSSYATRIARRIEEEKGPHAYCTAFTAYQIPDGGAIGTWRPLQMNALVATALSPMTPAGGGTFIPANALAWELLPFAPSMTGRGLIAACSAACVPDSSSTEKLLPLERLTSRKTELGVAAALMSRPTADLFKVPSNGAPITEAEEYASLLVLEERLLIAFVGDCPEAVSAVATEARRRIDSMVARLRVSRPDEPPPGLKEWPAGDMCTQWTGRTWDKICRGATLCQGLSMPSHDVTDAKVTHMLLWAEIATLYEIVSSFESIRLTLQGRMTLGGVRQAPGCLSEVGAVQIAHLGATLDSVAKAEHTHFSALLQGSKLDELFSLEVEDLPSECDLDTANIHALVQTTNAELNLVWSSQRAAVAAGEAAQLFRVVRLRELALSAPFLLMKQAQGLKPNDALTLEWLQQAQAGCWLILHKSAILCEALSAVVGPQCTSAEAIQARLEEMGSQLEALSATLASFQTTVSSESTDDESTSKASQVEQVLNECETHMLLSNLLILALERQTETAATAAPAGVTQGMRTVREGTHALTLKVVLVRSAFELPLVEDTATFANESQRRGRKLRVGGRAARRAAALPAAPKTLQAEEDRDLACDEAAVAEAEAQATALLQSEEVSQAKKVNKKRKQRAKKAISSNGAAVIQVEIAAGKCKEKELEASKEQNLKAPSKDSSEQGDSPARDRKSSVGDGNEPEEEAAPAGDENQGAEELLLLEKGPFELLGERRKARLLAIERSSGASCTMDISNQAVRLSGAVSSVAAAKKLLEDICVKWLEVSRPVWAVLLRGRAAAGPLGRLQAETSCSVVVDRTSARLRIAGTSKQVLAGQEWLLQLTAKCDSTEVWLDRHVKDPNALVAEAEASSLSIKAELVRKKGWHVVQIHGLAGEVNKAAEMLRAATQLPSPTLTNGSTTATDLEVNSEVSEKETSSGPAHFVPSRSSTPESRKKASSPDKGDQTPSDWGESEPIATSPLALLQSKDRDDWIPSGSLAVDDENARAVCLAEQLSRKFPSARIIIGEPDDQGSGTDILELQMQRLRKLLDQDTIERKRMFARFKAV